MLASAVTTVIGPDAQAYSQAMGVLAGFALLGITIYLSRRDNPGSGSENAPTESATSRITPDNVVAALFYAMASLIICTFLYSRMAGEQNASDRTMTAMQLFGLAAGLSVLSLFYALTLMLFEHDTAKEKSASYAYWIVVITGPPVVLSFLTTLAYHASGNNGWVMAIGASGMAVLFAGSILLTRSSLPEQPPFFPRFCQYVAHRPPWPSLLGFVVAILTGTVGSLWIMTRSDGFDAPIWLTVAILVVSFLTLAVFAFACACVANTRTDQWWLRWLPFRRVDASRC